MDGIGNILSRNNINKFKLPYLNNKSINSKSLEIYYETSGLSYII
jgi:hypothetical protein